MAEAAVTFLLENVSKLLKSHCDLISGAENELEQLKNELGLLKDLLQKTKEEEEPFMRNIERQIREVVCDVEDTIDSFLWAQAVAAKAKTGFNPNGGVSLAKELKSLREDKVKPMLEFAYMQIGDGSTGIISTTAEEPWTKLKKVHQLNMLQENVLSFEDEEEKIIGYLKEETEELDVISIIGNGGLGKTTLARNIFHDQRIDYEFPTRIWMKYKTENEDDLAGMIRSLIEKRKFLIVMDNVWSTEDWDELKVALPITNRGSKVLITSRDASLGRHANPKRVPHQMRYLNPDDCWKLLQFKVFGGETLCPPELEDVGKRIAHRCGGLPLSVSLIAGVLLDETNIKTWQKVVENTNTREFMEYVVLLSYNSLPDHLKLCFLYIGMFPEDFEIPVWKLTRMWIAEGFVLQVPGMSLEDIADNYLAELICRNLLMVDRVRPDGKVKTCRMHGMLREFCQIKAGSTEINLFQEVRKPMKISKQHRRVCIHSHHVLDFFSCLQPNNYSPFVRSFLCFSKDELVLLPGQCSLIPKAFELLRVLEVKPIRFTRLPRELMLLLHLRYIVLSTNMRILPEAFSELRNTQTLIIDTTWRILEIRADIWKMVQLRHLKTNASAILLKPPPPDNFSNEGREQQELQTLVNISSESCTKDVFDKARHLKKLGIQGRLAAMLVDETERFNCFWKLRDLENLKLLNDVFPSQPSEGRLPRLPPPEKFPAKLRSLTLSATFLDWEQMSVLGNLENLEVLKLKDNAFVGESWEVADGGFRLLRLLLIECTNLVYWKLALGSGHDHFPRLKGLVLRKCTELEALPDGLANVASLHVIDLFCTSKTAVASARKIQEMRGYLGKGRELIKLSIFPPDR
ncbi:hypothetical protein DH2020_042745 [Rehmannia glutinosa]|uniref:Uncharacterized protein n=1 Tax=Rehmannia glutinosa TaxID=99300 RepID=A0ABR0ULK6_REHGL